MGKRKIISIKEDLCNGCGLCAKGCPEGALKIIDGKARLVSEIYCDGLGACIGDCPLGAIEVEEREAQEYSEKKTMKNIVAKGENTIKAHLVHLLQHNEVEYFNQALKYLRENKIPVPDITAEMAGPSTPFPDSDKSWPVQLKLLNPKAGFLRNSHLLIAADCTAFSYGDFHRDFMEGKVPVIFCPKLDSEVDKYIEKLTSIFKDMDIEKITMVRMEVPCCGGVGSVVEKALDLSEKEIPVEEFIISITGDVK
ncbi:MAG: 4Fe-4S ferredoxin [Candidatus Muiribacterium halophilum]|uniref:4Fe-4S ferredoxin n=1 Tax=Muiribacterium halophilum TaxID=2053465 RepID=A0A2N5ZGL4_MUIH1|nr:MAG: 4Fe-4S ferredoxin [Candidatus Muirbacterium halophilum]